MDKVRGAIFSTLELGMHLEMPKARVLDLFAGSGAYGLEALSRGAVFADFVEKEHEAQECIRQNLALTKLEKRGRVHALDVFNWLNQNAGRDKYDLVLADPPYERPARGVEEPEPDETSRLLGGPWAKILTTHGILVLEQAIERPVEEVAGLDLLRFRRYGKTVVVYYALPGAYEVGEREIAG